MTYVDQQGEVYEFRGRSEDGGYIMRRLFHTRDGDEWGNDFKMNMKLFQQLTPKLVK